MHFWTMNPNQCTETLVVFASDSYTTEKIHNRRDIPETSNNIHEPNRSMEQDGFHGSESVQIIRTGSHPQTDIITGADRPITNDRVC